MLVHVQKYEAENRGKKGYRRWPKMVFKAKLKTTFLMKYLIYSSVFENCDNEEVSGAQEHID